MIKFKEFNVGDPYYQEQMEQFQTEHPTAEFVQITGGYTSYEKIWFKYEPSDTSSINEELSVDKLQEQFNTTKKALEEIVNAKDNLYINVDGRGELDIALDNARNVLEAIGNE